MVVMAQFGIETGSQATRIAALVWGRDDDGADLSLTFKQVDVDKIVQLADHRGPMAMAGFEQPALGSCMPPTAVATAVGVRQS